MPCVLFFSSILQAYRTFFLVLLIYGHIIMCTLLLQAFSVAFLFIIIVYQIFLTDQLTPFLFFYFALDIFVRIYFTIFPSIIFCWSNAARSIKNSFNRKQCNLQKYDRIKHCDCCRTFNGSIIITFKITNNFLQNIKIYFTRNQERQSVNRKVMIIDEGRKESARLTEYNEWLFRIQIFLYGFQICVCYVYVCPFFIRFHISFTDSCQKNFLIPVERKRLYDAIFNEGAVVGSCVQQ